MRARSSSLAPDFALQDSTHPLSPVRSDIRHVGSQLRRLLDSHLEVANSLKEERILRRIRYRTFGEWRGAAKCCKHTRRPSSSDAPLFIAAFRLGDRDSRPLPTSHSERYVACVVHNERRVGLRRAASTATASQVPLIRGGTIKAAEA